MPPRQSNVPHPSSKVQINQKDSHGMEFLKENIWKLEFANPEHMPCGFEVSFPTLIEMGRKLDIEVPDDYPIFKEIYAKRNLKLQRIPKDILHKVPTPLLHTLEGLGMTGLEWEKLLKLRCSNGSFLFSTASTAYALMQTKDENCFKYLNGIVEKFNGGVPHCYPMDLFERLWVVDRLERLGISRYFQSEIKACLDYVYRACQLLFPGERILEEAKKFSSKFLREKQACNELLDKWVIAKDLPGEWETWIMTWQEDGDMHKGEAKLLVRTINLCANFDAPEKLSQLSHPQYKQLSNITNGVCCQLLQLEQQPSCNEIHDNEKCDLVVEIQSKMEELVQLVVCASSDDIDSDIKQTFLAVAKSYYYAAHFAPATIDAHIAKGSLRSYNNVEKQNFSHLKVWRKKEMEAVSDKTRGKEVWRRKESFRSIENSSFPVSRELEIKDAQTKVDVMEPQCRETEKITETEVNNGAKQDEVAKQSDLVAIDEVGNPINSIKKSAHIVASRWMWHKYSVPFVLSFWSVARV
ncbi:hypothetical protein Vadar_001753 [Vaccinium darrowii]|uniref:Uncharacterized protein n=1 Tax=Vaccinium darrowii TaxID=229202 RepID=A0ACB7YSP8_9ERIC|nr:hypothetical protein Vadar_001753 [Vaccinium darrowii]